MSYKITENRICSFCGVDKSEVVVKGKVHKRWYRYNGKFICRTCYCRYNRNKRVGGDDFGVGYMKPVTRQKIIDFSQKKIDEANEKLKLIDGNLVCVDYHFVDASKGKLRLRNDGFDVKSETYTIKCMDCGRVSNHAGSIDDIVSDKFHLMCACNACSYFIENHSPHKKITKVAIMFADGKTPREIYTEFGNTRQYVSESLDKIKKYYLKNKREVDAE